MEVLAARLFAGVGVPGKVDCLANMTDGDGNRGGFDLSTMTKCACAESGSEAHQGLDAFRAGEVGEEGAGSQVVDGTVRLPEAPMCGAGLAVHCGIVNRSPRSVEITLESGVGLMVSICHEVVCRGWRTEKWVRKASSDVWKL